MLLLELFLSEVVAPLMLGLSTRLSPSGPAGAGGGAGGGDGPL